MNKAFQAWKKRVVHDLDELAEGKDEGEERIEKEKTDWMSDFCFGNQQTPGMGALVSLGPTSSTEELLPYHTIPFNTERSVRYVETYR
eukprot:4640685-Pleurochrysis_carterae.AAC.1